MNARAEIDLGFLSPEEKAMAPRPLNRYQRAEEDWLYYALYLARGCRIRVTRLREGTADFYAERYSQDSAIKAAKVHAANLTRAGYQFTAELVSMMKREGV